MRKDTGPAYRPLADPSAWTAASDGVDRSAWDKATMLMAALAAEDGAWTDMVRRGALVAAAYHSGALAGLYRADTDLGRALLAGEAQPGSCGPEASAHVLANVEALVLARDTAADPAVVTETWIRGLHAVACRPQTHHEVPEDDGTHAHTGHGDRGHGGDGHGHSGGDGRADVHGHVLGHGDYKHHPNDVRSGPAGRRVFVPVAGVRAEMAHLVEALRGKGFGALHPAARSAYALHAVTHVGPFAAGNGRVARALASAPMLAVSAVPLLVPTPAAERYREALAAADAGAPAAVVAFVEWSFTGLVDAVAGLRETAGGPGQTAALRRWQARVQAAHRLHAVLPVALEGALERHRCRRDLGWLADLSDARVVVSGGGAGLVRFELPPAVLRAPSDDGGVVEEWLPIDAHPLTGDGDVVVLRADRADLRQEVRAGDLATDVPPAVSGLLDGLVDRAVTAFAVRVAAGADVTEDP